MVEGMLVALVLLWLVVAAGCVVGFLLVRQNGRILLRLEAIEVRLGQSWKESAPASLEALRQGLELGTPAPAFSLPDLEGRPVSLQQFRGQEVLLTFFSPTCGYCLQMAPDLAALSHRDAPAVLVISTGDREANRKIATEHGIACPVLLQDGMEVADKYQVGGTPMGYLVSPDGKIASPIAVGAKALLALPDGESSSIPYNGNGGHTHRGNKPLSESHVLRTGLQKGAAAPDFQLKTLGGGNLTLKQYRGRRVLLIFSAPDCEPCNQLAPQLSKIHASTPALQLVMVARGEAEANRRKAAEHGFNFPVGLQRHWEISRDYGIFATPVAFLIDEHGQVAAEMATGVDGILGLVAGEAEPGLKEAMPI